MFEASDIRVTLAPWPPGFTLSSDWSTLRHNLQGYLQAVREQRAPDSTLLGPLFFRLPGESRTGIGSKISEVPRFGTAKKNEVETHIPWHQSERYWGFTILWHGDAWHASCRPGAICRRDMWPSVWLLANLALHVSGCWWKISTPQEHLGGEMLRERNPWQRETSWFIAVYPKNIPRIDWV